MRGANRGVASCVRLTGSASAGPTHRQPENRRGNITGLQLNQWSINGLRALLKIRLHARRVPDSSRSRPQRTADLRRTSARDLCGGRRGRCRASASTTFLSRILKDVPRSLVYRILRTGEVRVNGGRAQPDYRLVAGDRIRLPPLQRKAERAAQPLTTRRRARCSDFVSGADHSRGPRSDRRSTSPPGVAVHGGSGLSFGVIEALRAAHPELNELELVHRLDRDTSGCLLVAKRRAVLRELHALLRERDMEKRYLALVVRALAVWRPRPSTCRSRPISSRAASGSCACTPTASRRSRTFKPMQHFGKLATLLEVSLGTGRTHQIRVHAAHAGHPIAGDEKYGDRERDAKLQAVRSAADVPACAVADVPAQARRSRSASARRCRRNCSSARSAATARI